MKSTLVFVVLAVLLLATSAPAKSDFTGDWKLNPSKSDFGQMPAPTSMTQKITHEDPKLKVFIKQTTDQGEFEREANYLTDGTETTNDFRGNPMKSTAKWDGEILVIQTKASFSGNELTIEDKWSLSADGKTLTVKRHFASSMGEMDSTVVLEKQ